MGNYGLLRIFKVELWKKKKKVADCTLGILSLASPTPSKTLAESQSASSLYTGYQQQAKSIFGFLKHPVTWWTSIHRFQWKLHSTNEL